MCYRPYNILIKPFSEPCMDTSFIMFLYIFIQVFPLNCHLPIPTAPNLLLSRCESVCATTSLDIFCAFAGEKRIWADQWGCVQAWTAFVWASAIPTALHGPWCLQLQPPGHGFLPAHSSTPQGRYNSAGHADFWVGQAPCECWSYGRESKRVWRFFLIFCRDPSNWSAETMEALGPLLLLDDNATSVLPNKVQ